MKKILLALLIFGGTSALVSCSNETNNTQSSSSTKSSSITEDSSSKSSMKVYPANSEEWHLGKVDVQGFINTSNKDLDSALSDLSLVAELSLNSYFSTPLNQAKFEFSNTAQDPNFYSFSVTNLNITDKESMEIFNANVKSLMSQEPINPDIDLYTFTATYSSSAEVDDGTPLVISYILNEDGTLSEVGGSDTE